MSDESRDDSNYGYEFMLEIKNLSVAIKGKPILDGLNLTREDGRGRGDHGAERLGQVDAVLRHRRQARL